MTQQMYHAIIMPSNKIFETKPRTKKIVWVGTHCDENPELITTVLTSTMTVANIAHTSLVDQAIQERKNPLRSNGAFKFYDRI